MFVYVFSTTTNNPNHCHMIPKSGVLSWTDPHTPPIGECLDVISGRDSNSRKKLLRQTEVGIKYECLKIL